MDYGLGRVIAPFAFGCVACAWHSGFFPGFSRLFFCFLLLLYTNIIYPRSSFTITVNFFIEKSPIVRNNPRPLMVPPKGGRHLSFPFRRHCGHVLWMYCTDRQAGRHDPTRVRVGRRVWEKVPNCYKDVALF